MAKLLTPTGVDADGGIVVLELRDSDGEPHEIRLPTLDAMSLAGMLISAVTDATKGQESGGPWPSLPFHHLQLEQIGETLSVRIFVADRVAHEYHLPLDTTLAQDLLAVTEARHASKVTHPGSDSAN